MTALSIALVLCVAMVCATRIYLKRVEHRRILASLVHDVHKALTVAESARDALSYAGKEISALCAEVDKLKANAAFRSLG